MAKDDFKPNFAPQNPDAVDAALRNAISLNAAGLQGLMNADVQAPLRKLDGLKGLDDALRSKLPLAIAGVAIGEALSNGSVGLASGVASIAGVGVVSQNRVVNPIDSRIEEARSDLNYALKHVDTHTTVPTAGGGRNAGRGGRG